MLLHDGCNQECDVLSLRIAKFHGNINLGQYKAVVSQIFVVVYIYGCVCSISTCTHVCIHYVQTCSMYTSVCTYACMLVCVHLRMYMTCTYICTLHAHILIHTDTSIDPLRFKFLTYT